MRRARLTGTGFLALCAGLPGLTSTAAEYVAVASGPLVSASGESSTFDGRAAGTLTRCPPAARREGGVHRPDPNVLTLRRAARPYDARAV
jgi:hypothetical protein